MPKSNYKFDPTKFGYLPPKQIPDELKEHIHKKAFVKVICTKEDGSFWYSSCNQYGCSDDRWVFESGLYDTKKPDYPCTRHQEYSGCITSESYAKVLLIHLLGTTTNEGTLKSGKERLLAKSLEPKKVKKDHLTIDEAIAILNKAKARMGGQSCLILSLTDSGIPDANVNNMEIIHDEDNTYVEVQVEHPDIKAD